MHDTGSVSTFEKYARGNGLLSDKQFESITNVQAFLRSVGIEKSQEEVVLLLGLLNTDELGSALAEIKAKWKISIPRPRLFRVTPEKDEALQKALVAQGPDKAKQVLECRTIAAGLAKFGLTMTVAEVLVAKGYYALPSMKDDSPVLRPAPDTGELQAVSKDEIGFRDEQPAKKKTPTPKPQKSLRKPEEKAKPEPKADPKKRKQLVFILSISGIAVSILLVVLAFALGVGRPEPPKPEKPAEVAKIPDKPKNPEPAKPAETTKKEPVKPVGDSPFNPPVKKDEPAKPAETRPAEGIPAPAERPEEMPTPADPDPIPPPQDPPTPSDPNPPPTPPVEPGKPDEKKPLKGAEREARAQAILDSARREEEAKRFREAQDKFKELRDNFRDTKVYVDNDKDVNDRIVECGFKLALASLAKQPLYKKPHLDTILGFTFQPPQGWRGIPNWQDIFGQRNTSEAQYKGKTYRVCRYTSRDLENLFLQAYKTYAPTDLADVMEGSRMYISERYPGLKELKSEPFQHPRHNSMRTLFTDDKGNRMVFYSFYSTDKKGYTLVGTWRGEPEDFFSFFAGTKARPPSEADFAEALKVFDQVARSFWCMDQSTLSTQRGSKKSAASSDGWVAECADWNVLTTKNYIIEFATRPEFATRLGKELEQIMSLYRQVIPSGKGIPKCRVKLFDCEEDFQYYGQAPGAAAYWSPMQEEIVAYRFEGRKVKVGESKEDMTVAEEKNPEEVTFNIIYHEAFHQYMFYLMGRDRDVYVPSWLNEGMGDYFFGGRWTKSGKFEIGINDWRLETIVKAVKEGKHVPLPEIIKYSQAQYYSNAGLCYAEGWAMNYFFLSPEGRKKGYQAIPAKMFDALQNSGNWEKATEKAFAGANLKQMDEEFKAFVLSMEKLLPKKAEEPKQR